jgi:hypothetical protein
MKALQKTFLAIIITSFFSFTLFPFEIEEEIIGIWVDKDYKEGQSIYTKQNTFDQKAGGIEFKKDGTLTKRQNAGSCGTAPIYYKNFSGTWKKISDSRIFVRYKYWGGEIEENWLIVEINEKLLSIEKIGKLRVRH